MVGRRRPAAGGGGGGELTRCPSGRDQHAAPKKERWVEGKKEGQAVRRSGSPTGTGTSRLGTAVGP
jgi:hypothetical protein